MNVPKEATFCHAPKFGVPAVQFYSLTWFVLVQFTGFVRFVSVSVSDFEILQFLILVCNVAINL